jgi:hypothetical protein
MLMLEMTVQSPENEHSKKRRSQSTYIDEDPSLLYCRKHSIWQYRYLFAFVEVFPRGRGGVLQLEPRRSPKTHRQIIQPTPRYLEEPCPPLHQMKFDHDKPGRVH